MPDAAMAKLEDGDGELAFIERLRAMLPAAPAGQRWIGDDAAVLEDGLLLKTDVLVEGVHFELDWSSSSDVGWKALAVNLSDIAAMGGRPMAAVVSLVVRPDQVGVADGVMAGMIEAAVQMGCPIVGGDTSSGPALMVAVAVLGHLVGTGPVLRSGAHPGDVIFVTGELGAAGSALRRLRDGVAEPEGIERLRRPTPRLAEGVEIAAAGATAMIDLSDGLAVDLRRVCDESGCAATIDVESLPRFAHADVDAALFGGDDYELLFTVPPDRASELRSRTLDPITPIGLMYEGAPGIVVRESGVVRRSTGQPFEHRIAGPGAFG